MLFFFYLFGHIMSPNNTLSSFPHFFHGLTLIQSKCYVTKKKNNIATVRGAVRIFSRPNLGFLTNQSRGGRRGLGRV